MSTKAYTYGYGICVEKIKDVEKDRLLSLIRMARNFTENIRNGKKNGNWDRDMNRMWEISW
ncbi:MAG: hypothetical protein ACLTX3_08780 [Lachnospiraceae bacterium]